MMGQLRAERLKATTTRMWWILLIIAIALTLLSIVPTILLSGVPEVGINITDPDQLNTVWAALGQGSVIALIAGLIAITAEFRHQTITDAFLAEPNRFRFLAAKAVVQFVIGVALAVCCAVVGLLAAFALLPFKDHAPIDTGHIVEVVAANLLLFALYAVLGLAVGSLITNQVAALIITLLWVLLLEPIIVGFLPVVGKWLPGGGAGAITQAPTLGDEPLLPVWGGALLLIGYAVVIGAVGARTTLQRDIT